MPNAPHLNYIPHLSNITTADPIPHINVITPEATTTWLGRGFSDFAAHPGIGLSYGLAFAAIGWLLTFGLEFMGMGSLILPLSGGFLLVAPLAACGLYEVSRRRETGEPISLGISLSAIFRNRHMADMGLALMLVFFAWCQVAMILFALFFGSHPPALGSFFTQIVMAPQGIPFLATGSLVGAIFAAVAFSLSVVSLPMLMDSEVSALNAMRTSLAVVRRNSLCMIGWAATLAVLGAFGLSSLFIGLIITLPIAAHASWHAYRDLVAK